MACAMHVHNHGEFTTSGQRQIYTLSRPTLLVVGYISSQVHPIWYCCTIAVALLACSICVLICSLRRCQIMVCLLVRSTFPLLVLAGKISSKLNIHFFTV